MRLLIVGDLHIPNNKTSINNSDLFKEILDTFKLIRETILDRKPDLVIFMGDIFDTSTNISTIVLSYVSTLINAISDLCGTVIISGNHDIPDVEKTSIQFDDEHKVNIKVNLLSPFKHFNNMVVYDEPSIEVFDDIQTELWFIPYTKKIKEHLNILHKESTSGYKKILFGHWDVKNMYYVNTDSNKLEAMHHPTAEELVDKYGIDLTVLGHYHNPKEFKFDNGLVKYTGACRNIDFKCHGNNKGIYILDLPNMEIEKIPNPYTYTYKIFRTSKDLVNYVKNYPKETVAKTKVLYVYTKDSEVLKLNKHKKLFKSIKYEKNLLASQLDSSNIDKDNFKNMQELVSCGVLTEEKIFDFAFEFVTEEKKDINEQVLKFIKRYEAK